MAGRAAISGEGCPGHPRLSLRRCSKTWMPATRPGMTMLVSRGLLPAPTGAIEIALHGVVLRFFCATHFPLLREAIEAPLVVSLCTSERFPLTTLCMGLFRGFFSTLPHSFAWGYSSIFLCVTHVPLLRPTATASSGSPCAPPSDFHDHPLHGVVPRIFLVASPKLLCMGLFLGFLARPASFCSARPWRRPLWLPVHIRAISIDDPLHGVVPRIFLHAPLRLLCMGLLFGFLARATSRSTWL